MTGRSSVSSAPFPVANDVGRFDLAAPGDEAEVRRLLRDNPMDGGIRLSLEPAHGATLFAGSDALVRQTIVGRRRNGGLFALGERIVRPMYINGQPTPVGYLGSLRLDADHRRNPRALLRGYQRLRQLHDADRACPFYLTSIMADNRAARRFLEANLPAMPTYRFIAEYVSLVMRVRRRAMRFASKSSSAQRAGLSAKPGSDDTLAAVAELLGQSGRRFQFSPVWPATGLPRGPQPADFLLALNPDGRVVACAALWDQRSVKQTVVRGYSPALARWRPAVNAFARLVGRPRLPAVGEPVQLAYVSHVASAEGSRPLAFAALVESLHATAATRGLDYLVAGFAADDPRLVALRRRFGGRELRSRLYVVYWEDGRRAAETLDGRAASPGGAHL
jgi:hypothetical protein